jgi:hypothetical protein
VDNCKNITSSQNSVRKKSFERTFTFSNCHIIGLDPSSLVLIVFGGIIVDRRTQQMNLVTQVVAEGKGRKFAVVAAKKRLVLQKYQKLLSYIPT